MAYTATAVADWDSTKPVGTETPSALDDALREVKVCVENDVRTTTQIQNDAAASVPGLVIRSKYTYSTTSAILIDPGIYHHQGTTEQTVFWDTQLTFTFGSGGSNSDSVDLAGADWFYLYLDDSAIVTLGANTILTNSEFVANITEPTWTVGSHAWMNGNDRCIGGFYVNGSNNIVEFFHDGGDQYSYADEIEDLALTDIDDTWTDVTLTIPKFSTKASVTLHTADTAAGAAISCYWRTNGQSGSTGHLIGSAVNSGDEAAMNECRVFSDSSQIIEVRKASAGLQRIGALTNGYYFPAGM